MQVQERISFFYRRLHSTVAKRMLRFLDKRFYHRRRWDFPLVEFACEHIGLSRRYDTGQLKRRMMPAIAELEDVGFIARAPADARFVKLSRGHWQVTFTKAARRDPQPANAALSSSVVEQLVARGVHARVAKRLAAAFTADVIATHVAAFDALRSKSDGRVSRNPAGYLVQSIRRGYRSAPNSDQTNRQSHPSRRIAPNARGDSSPLDSATTAKETADFARVAEFLASLSPAQRREIESQAVQTAPSLLREGAERAATSDIPAARSAYQAAMLRQHVLRILGEPGV